MEEERGKESAYPILSSPTLATCPRCWCLASGRRCGLETCPRSCRSVRSVGVIGCQTILHPQSALAFLQPVPFTLILLSGNAHLLASQQQAYDSRCRHWPHTAPRRSSRRASRTRCCYPHCLLISCTRRLRLWLEGQDAPNRVDRLAGPREDEDGCAEAAGDGHVAGGEEFGHGGLVCGALMRRFGRSDVCWWM